MSEAARSPLPLITRTLPDARILVRAAGLVACGLYLARFVTMPPNHSDGGLLLDYIRLMGEGQWPYWDFIDAYGPLNWALPVLAYRASGGQVWAIASVVALHKLVSVVLCFELVRRLAGTLPAWIAGFWMTVLLGAPWQMLQTPYAMHPVLALELAVWLLLLAPPRVSGRLPGPSSARVAVAGALTGLAFWIKVNSGAFLLLAGLFYCFYWVPGRARPESERAPAPRILALGAWLGLLVYGGVFLAFVRRDLLSLFFPYLVLPLLLVLGVTALELWRAPASRSQALDRLRAWAIFVGGAAGVILGFFLLYFGVEGGIAYVREIAPILAGLDYDAPFPPLGKPGLYVGFTELYWPQLPWLATLGFLALCLARRAQRSAESRRVWVGLFVLFTFQTFVIYSRADEAHLVQGVWPAVPVVAALFGILWNEWGRPLWGVVPAMGAVAVALPLVVPPMGPHHRMEPGQWNSSHLRHLAFHPLSSPYIREFHPRLTNHDWDVAANQAARHIDRVTDDGAVILVTLRNELLHLNSNTRAFGGRHRFLFYLLNQGLISPETFEALIPQAVLRELVENPPPVIVNAYGPAPELFRAIPEVARIFATEYERTGTYAHILVYERKSRGSAE